MHAGGWFGTLCAQHQRVEFSSRRRSLAADMFRRMLINMGRQRRVVAHPVYFAVVVVLWRVHVHHTGFGFSLHFNDYIPTPAPETED